jgi:hypothetical protein
MEVLATKEAFSQRLLDSGNGTVVAPEEEDSI